jgi:hypothetical protein
MSRFYCSIAIFNLQNYNFYTILVYNLQGFEGKNLSTNLKEFYSHIGSNLRSTFNCPPPFTNTYTLIWFNLIFELLNYGVIKTLKYWITELLNCWIVELLTYWIIELLNYWIIELLNYWIIELLNYWIIELLNYWIIQLLN